MLRTVVKYSILNRLHRRAMIAPFAEAGVTLGNNGNLVTKNQRSGRFLF